MVNMQQLIGQPVQPQPQTPITDIFRTPTPMGGGQQYGGIRPSGGGDQQGGLFAMLQQLLGGKGGNPMQSAPKMNPFDQFGGGGGQPSFSPGPDVMPQTPFGGGGTSMSSFNNTPLAGTEMNLVNPFKGLINAGFAR